MNPSAQIRPDLKLAQILSFLDQDPSNTALLSDAASLAFDAGDFDLSGRLIKRYSDLKPLGAQQINLLGLISISQQRFGDAVEIFEALRAQGTDNPALRFNLAWAQAMTGAWQQALDLLDDETLASSRRAPALKIQVLHHLGRLEDALACGETLSEHYPDDRMLMGALASVAIDAEKAELALSYGNRAGDNAEGQAAVGILTLGQQDVSGSLAMFEEALRKQPDNARALIGKGLGLLTRGDAADGVAAIDRGAELFRTHIGSWVAAGWAHFTAHDYAAARARFERAMALDPNFAETHGGLAVLDIVEGRFEDGARACEVALRLDKNCFGAALAKSLLLQHRGHPQMAQKVINIAMSSPVGLKGETLGQMVASLGRGPRR